MILFPLQMLFGEVELGIFKSESSPSQRENKTGLDRKIRKSSSQLFLVCQEFRLLSPVTSPLQSLCTAIVRLTWAMRALAGLLSYYKLRCSVLGTLGSNFTSLLRYGELKYLNKELVACDSELCNHVLILGAQPERPGCRYFSHLPSK
jgi:hypothetical protein